MLEFKKDKFSTIVKDNERAIEDALASGHFVQAYLLIHALIESLLRIFLKVPDKKKISFDHLINKYQSFLDKANYPFPTFVDELRKFNRLRNRIVHKQLWANGYSFTNNKTEPAVRSALIIYGLFIEWLETFDSGVNQMGFKNNDNVL